MSDERAGHIRAAIESATRGKFALELESELISLILITGTKTASDPGTDKALVAAGSIADVVRKALRAHAVRQAVIATEAVRTLRPPQDPETQLP